jgi:glucokinase
VIHGRAQLTNAGWPVVAADVGRRFGVRDVRLLNDLEATAWSLPVLTASELEVLQCGEDSPGGNAAIIAAGTGLGMAIALRSGTRFLPVASEGGHATFAPTTEREIALLRQLTALRGRAQWEDIVSGPGLVTLHAFTHATACSGVPAGLDLSAMPAAISEAALRYRCPACREALHLFVSAYGSAAGDLALIATATGGLYLGGGIAPKILPALRSSAFMTAFGRKAPMEALMARIPVQVILNPEAALLGAATHASAPAGPGGTALN